MVAEQGNDPIVDVVDHRQDLRKEPNIEITQEKSQDSLEESRHLAERLR